MNKSLILKAGAVSAIVGGLAAGGLLIKHSVLVIDRAKDYYEILEGIRQRREKIADEAIRSRWKHRTNLAHPTNPGRTPEGE